MIAHQERIKQEELGEAEEVDEEEELEKEVKNIVMEFDEDSGKELYLTLMEFIADHYKVQIDDVIERRSTHKGKFIAKMINKYVKFMPDLVSLIVFGAGVAIDIKHIQNIAEMQKVKAEISKRNEEKNQEDGTKIQPVEVRS